MISLIRPECPNPVALVEEIYNDPVNKDALRKSTSGKCMYCEGKMEPYSYAHVEHIKPKAKFPELKFTWSNLGFSCQVCNTKKGEKYDKSTPFINPYNEDPEDHLEFIDFYVLPKHGSKRGVYTIKEIDLNRANLVDIRKERYEKLKMMVNATFRTSKKSLRNQSIEELKKEAENDKEYSAMVKSLLVTEKILETKLEPN